MNGVMNKNHFAMRWYKVQKSREEHIQVNKKNVKEEWKKSKKTIKWKRIVEYIKEHGIIKRRKLKNKRRQKKS